MLFCCQANKFIRSFVQTCVQRWSGSNRLVISLLTLACLLFTIICPHTSSSMHWRLLSLTNAYHWPCTGKTQQVNTLLHRLTANRSLSDEIIVENSFKLKLIHIIQQAFIDIRLRPGITMPLMAVAEPVSLHLSASRPLRPNGASSIEPDVHNVAQRRRKRIEPGDRRTIGLFRIDQSSGSRDMLADRQTDTQTRRETGWSQYSTPLPRRSNKTKRNEYKLNRRCWQLERASSRCTDSCWRRGPDSLDVCCTSVETESPSVVTSASEETCHRWS